MTTPRQSPSAAVCPHCGSKAVKLATTTDYVIYLRCAACGEVWSLPKPPSK